VRYSFERLEMQFKVLSLFIFSLTLLTSCVDVSRPALQSKTYEPEMNEVRNEPIIKKGFKCDLISTNDYKEIFIHIEEKKSSKTLQFHDFTSPHTISLLYAKFDGFTLRNFPLEEIEEDGKSLLTGESYLGHSEHSERNGEGRLILFTGRIKIDKDLNGTIEKRKGFSKSIQDAHKFEPFGDIKNCVEFEAEWLRKITVK
jgi:hypothetical protein